MPPAILAILVGLAALAPASTTLAHQAPVMERAVVSPAGAFRAEARDAAGTGLRAPVEDRPVAPDGRRIGGDAARQVRSWPSGVPAWLVVILIGLAAAPWRRRAVASLAVLALAVLAFETGVHSVHHLGDEAGASHCSVASASTHLAGTPEEGPALHLPVLTASKTLPLPIAPVADAPFRCDATRGPPSPLGS